VATFERILGDDPAALLERAAEPLLQRRPGPGPFDSPPCLLVLRQGGLRDDLYRLAAERDHPGWFGAPVCLFQELPSRLGSTGRRPLSDPERRALLASLLRDHGGATFAGRVLDFVPAIEQWFGELRAEGIEPAAYAGALTRLAQREKFEEQRDADLAGVYGAYVDALDRLGRRDGRDALADTAIALRERPQDLAGRLAGRREIRVVGLADLRGGWRSLLRALRDAPALDRVVLYGLTPPDLPDDLAAAVTPEASPGGELPASLPGRVEVLTAPDPD
jgi:hypothetical protein